MNWGNIIHKTSVALRAANEEVTWWRLRRRRCGITLVTLQIAIFFQLLLRMARVSMKKQILFLDYGASCF